jgi:hypothetical protein
MEHDRMKRSLGHLGIPVADYRVLKLLPLIYVAWADGKMDLVKRERIHAFAAQEYDLSAAGVAVLERWLTRRPAPEYISEGLHDIFLLATAEDDMEVDFSELPGLLAYAERIADNTGTALNREREASACTERALEDVAHELHIDHGESWATLLNELQ